MALWDIKGKALGQPVWNLLGGRFRDRIQVYGHAKTPERARELMARGYKAMKVAFTGAVEIDRVAAVREAAGPDVDVMVDAHGPSWMTTQDAIAVGRALEPLDLLFYEDPVAPENLDALERIRDAVDIPLAAGERVSTIWGIRPYIERDLVDVIQPDTGRAGGITQMRKMAAMAEAHYITMAPHSGSLGPVAEFAALHVMATIPNALMLERIEFDWSGPLRGGHARPEGRRRPPACAGRAGPRRRHRRGGGRTISGPAQRRRHARRTTAGPTSPAPSNECVYFQTRLAPPHASCGSTTSDLNAHRPHRPGETPPCGSPDCARS